MDRFTQLNDIQKKAIALAHLKGYVGAKKYAAGDSGVLFNIINFYNKNLITDSGLTPEGLELATSNGITDDQGNIIDSELNL